MIQHHADPHGLLIVGEQVVHAGLCKRIAPADSIYVRSSAEVFPKTPRMEVLVTHKLQ